MQLRAVRADHLGLRIVNVGVDKPRRDDRAGVIVDDRARLPARDEVARGRVSPVGEGLAHVGDAVRGGGPGQLGAGLAQ